MILRVLDAQLSFARPAESVQNKSSLLSPLRQLSNTERGGQTLQITITASVDRAEKVRNFEVFVVRD
jgi:hypothetical protein